MGRNYYATEPAFSLTGTQASSNVNVGYLAGAPRRAPRVHGTGAGALAARPAAGAPTRLPPPPRAGAQGNVFNYVQGSKSSAARSEVLSATGQQQFDFDVGRRRRLAQRQQREQARRRL